MGVHGLFLMDLQETTEKNRFVVQTVTCAVQGPCQKTLEVENV